MRLSRTITDTSVWPVIIHEGLETHGEGRTFHKHRNSRAKMKFKFPVCPKPKSGPDTLVSLKEKLL